MYDELVKRLRFYQSGTLCYKEAADAIEELQKRVKTLTRELDEANQDADYANEAATALYGALPSWIPVTEQLPEQKKQVLVTGIEAIGNVQIYGVKQLDGDVWRPTSAPSCYWEHWMPLPEPPKEGK